MTPKKIRDELREKFLAFIKQALETEGEEVLVTGSNEFAIPCVGSDGSEEFAVISVKIPTGSRDGEVYDGYGVAESFALHEQAVAEKKAKQAELKAKKIAKDKADRAAKAKAKAEHESKKNGA